MAVELPLEPIIYFIKQIYGAKRQKKISHRFNLWSRFYFSYNHSHDVALAERELIRQCAKSK
jgi:hypothetical protein